MLAFTLCWSVLITMAAEHGYPDLSSLADIAFYSHIAGPGEQDTPFWNMYAVWKPGAVIPAIRFNSNYDKMAPERQKQVDDGFYNLFVHGIPYEPSREVVHSMQLSAEGIEGSEADAVANFADAFNFAQIDMEDVRQYDKNSRYGTGDELCCWIVNENMMNMHPENKRFIVPISAMPMEMDHRESMLEEFNLDYQ